MDLRRRTTHLLAGSGALLLIAGLSLGGGVAVAVPGPSAQPPADAAKATTTSSDTKASDGKSSDSKSSDSKSSDRKSKNRKSKSDRTGTDSSGSNSSPDSPGDSGSNDSTATSATTTPPSTSTPTSGPTATTRPKPPRSTATTAPTTPATTAPPTTASTEPVTADPTPADGSGQYDGGAPYQANEAPSDESTTTTAPHTARAPASRSGSGLPPGIHPIGSDTRTADSSPAPAGAPTPNTPAGPQSNPVVTAESQTTVPTTTAPAPGGASDPATAPAGEVSGTETELGDNPARSSLQLGQTGDGTRRLIIFGGVALLMGAVVVAFTGRERQALAATSLPVGPARIPRPRRELDGWEDGVPLAPAKRELARNRLGISASYYDDELEV